MPGCIHRIHRNLNASAGPILETDRHRKTRSELAVNLALSGAGTNRSP